MSELSRSEVAMGEVATIISKDVAISAKLLQVVNSVLFGLPTRVENVLQALNLLGVETVKGVVLAAGVYHVDGVKKIPGFLPQEIYSRAIVVGAKSLIIAYSFGLSRAEAADALTRDCRTMSASWCFCRALKKSFRHLYQVARRNR